MSEFILLGWCLFGGLTVLGFILNLRDLPLRKQRGQQIKQIAESLNWEFSPQHHLPDLDFLVNGNAINVIRGNFDQASVYILDTPVQTYVEPHENHGLWKPQMVTTHPGTKLILHYQNATLPQIILRPTEWGDQFFTRVIKTQNFVVYGNDINTLNAIFTPEVIVHYEKSPNLHIHSEDDRIILHFYHRKYLEPTKERFLDLVAEGKYISQLVKPFVHYQ